MNTPSSDRRRICNACQRPQSACLCACVRAVSSQVQLLVLQHPMEVGHAKNTARLLHLCLPGSRLEVGEAFSAQALHTWLHAPWPGQPADAVVRPVLLYPATPPDAQLPLVQPPDLPREWRTQPQSLRLVVLDGTWRKSRKMLYLNPGLQALPRIGLEAAPPSRYAIRKAHAPGQLSSFEAGVLALAQLQGWDASSAPVQSLLGSFDAAMDLHQQLQAQGRTSQH